MDRLEIFKDNKKVNDIEIKDKYKEITKIFYQEKILKVKTQVKKVYGKKDIEVKQTFTGVCDSTYIYKYYFEDVEA